MMMIGGWTEREDGKPRGGGMEWETRKAMVNFEVLLLMKNSEKRKSEETSRSTFGDEVFGNEKNLRKSRGVRVTGMVPILSGGIFMSRETWTII